MDRRKEDPKKKLSHENISQKSPKNENKSGESSSQPTAQVSVESVSHTKRCVLPRKVKQEKKELPEKSESKQAVNEFTHKCSHPICKNLKPFSSLSALNQHARIKHTGIRWICPYCQEEQSSKYSHERHIKRRHPKKHEENLDGNQFEMAHRVQMTEKAKDCFLGSLTKKVEYQEKLIVELKRKLKEANTKLAKLEGKPCDDLTDYGEQVEAELNIEIDKTIPIEVQNLDDYADMDDDYQENYGENDPLLIRSRRMGKEQKEPE